MNYIKENAENNRVKFTFTFDGAEFEAAVEKAYQQNKGKYSHEGFRKGKVPRKVLEGFYGKSLFFEDAINLLIPENYGKALDENPDVIPVDRPDFDIAELDDEKLVLTAVVTVEPKIELGQYKGLKLAKKEYTVSEDDVKAELDRALDRAGRLVDVDRPAEKGDTLILDYSGSIDGVKFDGGTAEKQNLVLGSNMFIPGFEDQLIGVKAGESRDVKVQFPANYGAENLAGKDAVFACTVHQVKVKELPALDDEFAKDVSDFDTLEAYKEDIKKNLQTANDRRAEQEAENDMIEAIVADIKVDSIPDCMIDSQTDDLIKQFEYRLMYQGMKLDDYLKYAGITMEQMRKDYRETAEKNVKTRLTMEKIIRDENIEVTDADVDARLAEIASNAKKDLDEYKKSVSVQQLDYIKNDLLFGKLINFLKEANTFEVKAEEKPAAKTTKTTTKKTAAKPAAKTTAKPATKPAAKTTAKKTVKDTTEGAEKKTAKQPKKKAETTETK